MARLTNLEMVLVLNRLVVQYDRWLDRRKDENSASVQRRKHEQSALSQAFTDYREAARNEESQ